MNAALRSMSAGIALTLIGFCARTAWAQSQPPIFEICDLDGALLDVPRATAKRSVYDVVLHVERARPMRIGPVRGSTDCQEYVGQRMLIEAVPLRRKQVAAMQPGIRVDIIRSSMDRSDRRGNYLGTEVKARLQGIETARAAVAESK